MTVGLPPGHAIFEDTPAGQLRDGITYVSRALAELRGWVDPGPSDADWFADRDAEVSRWNAAVAGHEAGTVSDAQLAQVRDATLGAIHARIMTDDRYQQRTH